MTDIIIIFVNLLISGGDSRLNPIDVSLTSLVSPLSLVGSDVVDITLRVEVQESVS